MKASTSLLLASLTLTAIVPCAALAQDDYGDLDGDEPTKKTTTKQRKRRYVARCKWTGTTAVPVSSKFAAAAEFQTLCLRLCGRRAKL
jgi:hypothetical protein